MARGMNERIQKLRELSVTTPVHIDLERARIETDFYRKNDGKYSLKEGDLVSVTVRNTNLTIGQQMKNFVYKVLGNDTYTITASKSGLVTASGATSTIY